MDFQSEALRVWKQNTVGTASTPPAEFITAFAISKLSENVAELIESTMRIEDRVTRLERSWVVRAIPGAAGATDE